MWEQYTQHTHPWLLIRSQLDGPKLLLQFTLGRDLRDTETMWGRHAFIIKEKHSYSYANTPHRVLHRQVYRIPTYQLLTSIEPFQQTSVRQNGKGNPELPKQTGSRHVQKQWPLPWNA